MADAQPPVKTRKAPIRIVFEVLLLIALGVAIYFQFASQRGPRHLKLAVVTWTQDPFWQPLINGAQDAAAKSDVDVIVVQCKPTVEDQTQQVQQLLNSNIDGMAITPDDATAEQSLLNQVADKMPLITFDTDAPQSKRSRFVGIDNYAAGRICANEMEDALPEGGPILISVGSLTMEHGSQRRQGVIDGLLGRPFDRTRAADPADATLKGPKYSIVYTATDGGDQTTAVKAIADGLRAHPDVKGIVGLFSYSAPAALDAIQQVGTAGKIQIVGFDATPRTQAALKDGTIHSSIVQDFYGCGTDVVQLLADEARKVSHGSGEASPTIFIAINVLTPKNLDEMRQWGMVPVQTSTTNPAAP